MNLCSSVSEEWGNGEGVGTEEISLLSYHGGSQNMSGTVIITDTPVFNRDRGVGEQKGERGGCGHTIVGSSGVVWSLWCVCGSNF